jgi:glutamine amidotransferase
LSASFALTDLARSFALFLSKLRAISPLDSQFEPWQLQLAMVATIKQLQIWCIEAGITHASLLNFAVTDGATVVM